MVRATTVHDCNESLLEATMKLLRIAGWVRRTLELVHLVWSVLADVFVSYTDSCICWACICWGCWVVVHLVVGGSVESVFYKRVADDWAQRMGLKSPFDGPRQKSIDNVGFDSCLSKNFFIRCSRNSQCEGLGTGCYVSYVTASHIVELALGGVVGIYIFVWPPPNLDTSILF